MIKKVAINGLKGRVLGSFLAKQMGSITSPEVHSSSPGSRAFRILVCHG